MVTAAKTISQVFFHIGIAFAIAYWLTGSIVFGGIAALIEPVINVAILPAHQKFWARLRAPTKQSSFLGAHTVFVGEKISQLGMHMGIAFAVVYWATGSIAFGGLAAILEPVCNVLLLPIHDRAWEKIRAKLRFRAPHPFIAA